jgi:hypothetical protein
VCAKMVLLCIATPERAPASITCSIRVSPLALHTATRRWLWVGIDRAMHDTKPRRRYGSVCVLSFDMGV